MRRIVAVVACLFIAACSNDADGPSGVTAFSGEPPIQSSWLAARQPDNALAYLRVPYFLGLTSAPKDNALGPMMSSEAHVEQIESLLAGMDDNVASKPGLEHATVQWLLRHQRSPLEFSIGPVPGSRVKTPTMIISMGTSLKTTEAATTEFGSLLSKTVPGGSIEGSFDAGPVKILGAPMPGLASFDADSGRFVVLIGPGVNVDRLGDTLEALADVNPEPPMRTLEARIDESGQGYFSWISVKEALSMSQMFIPPNIFETINGMGLGAADAIAFGYGVSRGKTRMTLLADIPDTGGYRALIPVPDNPLKLGVTGEPNFALVMSLPTRDELQAILDEVFGQPDEAEELEEVFAKVSDAIGADIMDVYDLSSGELLLVSEPVGTYGAYYINDPKKLNEVLEAVAEKLDSPIRTERIAGIDIHHWKFPSLSSFMPEELLDDDDSNEPGMQTFLEIYTRVGTHMFWTMEGNYAIVASTPQLLRDRQRRGTPLQLGTWLRDTQKIDLRRSMLGFSSAGDGLPRFAHHNYIASIAPLADFTDVEFDPWAIPSADELGLPERGAVGLGFVSEESILGMELTMEHSPLDLAMSSGGLGSIAALGIVAAVAVPAYQDYTVRAQVNEGVVVARETQDAIEAFYAENKRFPGMIENEEFWREDVGKYVGSVGVEPDIGRVNVYFDRPEAHIQIYDVALSFTPYVDNNGKMSWNCSGDMATKYLPAVCRY